VHPTKREVHFLNEDAIVERVSDALQTVLVGKSGERVFEYQVRMFIFVLCLLMDDVG
jgi:DNA mismatch repair protein MLH1